MAASDYTRGEMEIEAQKSMYVGTMKAGAWGAIITLLMLGYATFTLSMGMPWLVALVVCAGAGIVIGLGMGFGGAWVATIVALSGLALFVQLLILVFSLAL
ncbi:MAG: aa3-type cytochrome c oxidase subunit IV [Pseudomonadota bacterium]